MEAMVAFKLSSPKSLALLAGIIPILVGVQIDPGVQQAGGRSRDPLCRNAGAGDPAPQQTTEMTLEAHARRKRFFTRVGQCPTLPETTWTGGRLTPPL